MVGRGGTMIGGGCWTGEGVNPSPTMDKKPVGSASLDADLQWTWKYEGRKTS